MKRKWFILLAIILLSGLIYGIISVPQLFRAPIRAPLPEQTEMVFITAWSGGAEPVSKESVTEPFTITSSPWIISGSTSPASDKAYFIIQIYNADTQRQVSQPISGTEITKGDTEISEVGSFYLKILYYDTEWELIVQEEK